MQRWTRLLFQGLLFLPLLYNLFLQDCLCFLYSLLVNLSLLCYLSVQLHVLCPSWCLYNYSYNAFLLCNLFLEASALICFATVCIQAFSSVNLPIMVPPLVAMLFNYCTYVAWPMHLLVYLSIYIPGLFPCTGIAQDKANLGFWELLHPHPPLRLVFS